jgi:hypothetical protein
MGEIQTNTTKKEEKMRNKVKDNYKIQITKMITMFYVFV